MDIHNFSILDCNFMAQAMNLDKKNLTQGKNIELSGASIVKDKNVISSGYADYVKGYKPQYKGGYSYLNYRYIVDACLNAIFNANVSLLGSTLYTTDFPSFSTSLIIVQCGIKKVIYYKAPSPITEYEKSTRDLFKMVGVSCEELPYDLNSLVKSQGLIGIKVKNKYRVGGIK